MSKDIFDFPDDAPFDPKVVTEVKTAVGQIGKDLILGKIEEANILRQAQEESGISSKSDAIYNLMNYFNIGIRALAQKTGVKRKLLLRMIEGDIPMPPDVDEKIQKCFKEENRRQKKNLSFDF